MKTLGRIIGLLVFLYGLLFAVIIGWGHWGLIGIIGALMVPLSGIAAVIWIWLETANSVPFFVYTGGLFVAWLMVRDTTKTGENSQKEGITSEDYSKSTEERLREAADLHKQGLIDEAEYKDLKSKILNTSE